MTIRDGDLVMGNGPIPPDQFEIELRATRHRVKAMEATQGAHGDMLRDAITRTTSAQAAADRAVLAASEAQSDVRRLSDDLFGRTDRRGDEGKLGEFADSVKEMKHAAKVAAAETASAIAAMRKQQWVILLLLLTAIGALIANFFSHSSPGK